MNVKNFLWALAACIWISSCTSRQELNYMKDIENVALENSVKNSRSTLQPGDQLIITVSARDLDVVKPFNQNYSSTATVAQYSQPSANAQFQPAPASGPMYFVDTNGTIDFPQLGNISVTGETTETLKDKLINMISRYVKEPVVEIKLVNFKVSVMGEVAKPGTYVVPDGNTTLLQALGLAGDLTIYGVRNNILIIRTVDGQITQERIDLTSAKFISSPYYYLKQNDLIYVAPNNVRERAASIDPNTGLYISVASVVASIAIGVLALIRN